MANDEFDKFILKKISRSRDKINQMKNHSFKINNTFPTKFNFLKNKSMYENSKFDTNSKFIYVNILDLVVLNIEIIDFTKLKSLAFVKYLKPLLFEYLELFKQFKFQKNKNYLKIIKEVNKWIKVLEDMDMNELLNDTFCENLGGEALIWLNTIRSFLNSYQE